LAGYRLSRLAEQQIDDILLDSELRFGALARARYAALLFRAMQDVADNPRRPTIAWPDRLGQAIGVYHIRHSRIRVADPPGRVGEPRHLLVCRIAGDGVVEFLGLMHERMLRGRALRRIILLGGRDTA